MRFTVLWTRDAENDLAALWLDAADRSVIASAVATIDGLLKVEPLACGESREGPLRIMFVPPLGIDFEVLDDDRIVYVHAVWAIRRG
jgi:hypothetical protein